MIEAYAFLAAFAVQVLVMSVLYPARLISAVRVKMVNITDERVTQLYPEVERFLTRYRQLNSGVAALGLLLLGVLLGSPPCAVLDWEVEVLTIMFFMLQHLPFAFVYWAFRRSKEALKRLLPEGKRTARLQRRGLFDFVSPLAVGLAVLSYFLFAILLLYIEQHPFPRFGGFFGYMGATTCCFVWSACWVYWMLYRRKHPLETDTDRMHETGLAVKVMVYSSIAVVVHLSTTLTLSLLSLKSWKPFAMTVYFLTIGLLCLSALRPRQSESGSLGSDSVPGTRIS